jgi:protein-tyrosine-phosphatase
MLVPMDQDLGQLAGAVGFVAVPMVMVLKVRSRQDEPRPHSGGEEQEGGGESLPYTHAGIVSAFAREIKQSGSDACNRCYTVLDHLFLEDEMTMTPMFVILGALMVAPGPQPVGTILFVCEHGSAKSVVAAAHFNRIAAARGLPFRAISRGTVPDADMAPAAVEGLLGDGLKPGDPAPTKLEQWDLDAAVRVVTFCALPPEFQARSPMEQWEVPPVSTEYAASREAMLVQIERLLLELATPK